MTSLADVSALAEQYRGAIPANELSFASHDLVDWECHTWAANPESGLWHKVTHRFSAVVKERALQGNACLVCAGYVIDDTNSLHTWFPEIAAQLDDDDLDPHTLPTSRHNATRKGGVELGKRYAELPWRCRHGHRWYATIANRVASGGCPDCSPSGLSKEQVRLTAELSGLLTLVQPDRSDPRLPDGLPNFGSHRIPIPAHLKPAEFRYGKIEVDAIFEFGGYLIGLEYDGAFHHSGKRRDRLAFTALKDRILLQLGYLPVHVRLGSVPELDSPGAVIVKLGERATAYEAATKVGQALVERLRRPVPGLTDYVRVGQAKSADLAERYIECVWGVKRPRASKRKPEGTPRKLRELRVTPPDAASWLRPAGPPYRSATRKGVTLRDYYCRCGNKAEALVQADVTRGNTRSCGCRAEGSKEVRHLQIPRAVTQEVRRWAAERDLNVPGNGRVSARLIASYLLCSADQKNLPRDEQGLVVEGAVREWALEEGIELLARDRLSEQIWYDFAAARGGSILESGHVYGDAL
ncbi:zinc-ribbon domain-containing protein [Streptosporangium oxazolinicum]|uniref:zinc-ribbon domain-containing protein n=1 Tax=Streptosporangium oxazolinicum TaxID=909287 RepID=UPI0031E54A36